MKKILFFLLFLIIAGAAYMAGQKGPDPTQWFLPPTATPTATATSTATSVYTAMPTATATVTATATATATSTPVPKKKAKKKPKVTKKHHQEEPEPDGIEATSDEPEEKPAPKAPSLAPPSAEPVCNSPALANVIAEAEPNNTFAAAQNLGELTAAGFQVKGFLETVAGITNLVEADSYKVDPKVDSNGPDLDVYYFTTSGPFLAVLDCYSSKLGRPNPLYGDNNFQLEVYDGAFTMVGSSYINDPVEAVEISQPGKNFYAVVYGLYGKTGDYRLTITPK